MVTSGRSSSVSTALAVGIGRSGFEGLPSEKNLAAWRVALYGTSEDSDGAKSLKTSGGEISLNNFWCQITANNY